MKYSSLITFIAFTLVAMTSCSKYSEPIQHATDEPFRSVYHHTPQAQWMNDPNGMFFDETTQTWHLYYQYYPEATVWGPMHWGHSTSKDLIHWEAQPIAIYPDANGMIFSGSCIIDRANTAGFGENAVVAIYTSADKAQNQSISYSLDGGMTFTAYEGNPVLLADIADFRDPKVMWDEQAACWTMVLACQQEVRFYQSADLKHWTLASRFGEGVGAHGGVWECPDLVKLKIQNSKFKKDEGEKWVLIVNINPGGPFGGSATQYFVGNWDGKEFTPCNSVCTLSGEAGLSSVSPKDGLLTKWLDFGKDHYATVTWHNAPDNRIVALGWMSNWEYATILPTVAFRSQNTVARDLSLFIDDAGVTRVRVAPSPESLAIKGAQTRELPDAAVVELDLCGQNGAVVTLSNEAGEQVVMTLDAQAQTFSMDRTAAGDASFSPHFAAVTTAPLFVKHDTHHITLFIDHCSIEAFGTNGEWSMTNLVFPSTPYNKIEVVGGEARIFNLKSEK